MTIDTKRLKTDAAYWDECEAPSDAEAAYTHEYGVQFLKKSGFDGDLCYFAPNKNWVPFLGLRDGIDRWRAAIPRPTKPAAPEWDEAEKFPPIGERVDACVYGDWQELVVSGYGNKFCIGINDDGEDVVFEFNDNTFRPIRTKERRERDDLIEVIPHPGFSTKEDIADAIIAAGYRKQEHD